MMVALGGPSPPPAMTSTNEAFKSVDFSDLPVLRTFTAKDGAALAYRYQGPVGSKPIGSVVLIHGSSASSLRMHVLAQGFARAGYAVYALNIRGHGASGWNGTISYP